ncbi:SusC/RagA family TonB-linked outer membrane protein [Sediminibacterium ginsengisoli]|uniref:TonB-linked outer membrane protein, SusC/RagA family n=1 Tax=Sediminibacterium ginsengisoli TaxID=413434 RepID=A0A1T4P9Q9_9BACT|nr:TonB-dependent receptor [Sediminibacterium ginsengisoli]SJZ88300.1 TonB-linked outer membrane protein, SusC/RagA family [Sediminibacterium ginsengisoli]
MKIALTPGRSLFLLPLLLFSCLAGIAQQPKLTVAGKVISAETSLPLSGASITIKETGKGGTTDSAGNFSIKVDKGQSLVIGYIGFESKEYKINADQRLSVSLVTVAATSEDVVVVGYGTQRKSHLTGAISKYKNDRLDETPVSRLDQALQGKIAGVQVQNTSSEAGSAPKIRVRGLSSINAGADPLVVVDGQPVPDGLAYVNMADVESVEVLKDAASSAIYGSRGASGVILVTTKSGKAEKTKYNFKFSSGAKSAYERYPMMSVTEYTKMLFDEAALKATDPSITAPTGNAIATAAERAAYVIENTLMGGKPTDWQSQALRTGKVQNIQLNASGGKKEIQYFISGAYQKDEGMMYHSDYGKYSIRTRVDAQLSKRVKLSINLNPSYAKRERPSVNYIDFVRFMSYLPVYHTDATAAFANQVTQWANIKPGDFAQARHFNGRVYSGLMPDGSNWVNTAASDPFATANNTPKSIMETRTITSNEYRVQGSADLTVNILPGLDFKSMASSYVNYTTGLDFAKKNSSNDGVVSKGIYNNRMYIDLLSENTFTYNKKIKEHSFNVLAGFTAQKTMIRDEQITGLDYPSDNITTLNTALQIDKANSYNTKNQIGLLSYLGRISYSYANKYLVSASYRSDGSSYFAPGKKWGSFPSLSLGWVASEEKFLQDVEWISRLKLRGSYGATGNNRITDFAFVDLLYAANYPFGTGTGTVTSGQAPSTTILSNPDVTWERTFQYNFGLDLALFRNRISLSVDMYQSKTDRLLLQQSAMAFTGVPLSWNNIGSLQNKGLEIEVTSNNITTKNFKWTTTANIAFNKNKVLELGSEAYLLNQGERTELYMNRVGDPLIQYYGYKTDGVWLSQAQINDAKAKGLTSNLSNLFVPGGLKLVDLNGDNVIDDKDRTTLGSPYPDFTYGITNNLNYKSFDLSFTIQGVQGGKLVNGDPNYNETKRYNRNYNTNRWLSPLYPGDGKTPYSTVGFNWMLTDYVIEDASYYALREVIIGYTLPKSVAKAAHLSSLRVYFSAQNLFFQSAKNYRGINPEARFNTGPYATPLVDGYQRGSFPMPRTVLFGLDINF